MKTFVHTLCLLAFSLVININYSVSQVFHGDEANAIIKNASTLKLDSARHSVAFVRLGPSSKLNESNYLSWLMEEVLSADGDNSWQLVKRQRDQYGFTHYDFRQFYKGIPVEYGTYKAHFKDGRLMSVNGENYGSLVCNTSASITAQKARSIAMEHVNASKYKDENSPDNKPGNQAGELVIFPTGSSFRLAYKLDIYAIEPLKRVYLYIDAITGKILFEENRIKNIDSQGTAYTGFSGAQSITTDSLGASNFRLRESGRGNGILTKNLHNGSNYSTATDFTDTDNSWSTTSIDQYAFDAHFGAEKTYDYYFDNYGLNSFDGAGAAINSYVHYGTSYVNAFWDGIEMTYGDGDGINYKPLTSLEIVGHEITHAVTEHSAGLVYSGESGALNESFSDIFGCTIRFLYTPSSASWFCGDQITVSGGTGNPFRNMADPNQFNCADTYGGLWWNYGDIVHYDSGVQNFWYYLLSHGGGGVNDNGDSYTVNGIGLTDAGAIAYRNLSVYLTPGSSFSDARFYAIQAAEDLFGTCSNQVIQTTNAWYAVGVGGLFSDAVVAGFSADANYFCAVPSTVNFTNISLNAATYEWDFGDGTAASTQANPVHTYTSPGIYSVTLMVEGSASCSSNDTITLSNYITLVNGGVPVAASCNPVTISYCCNAGISNFQFGSINKSSDDANEGYSDFTCGNNTTLVAGDPVPISVSTGASINESVKAWIDYDNNGVFDTISEQAFVSINKRRAHSGMVYTPVSAVLNTPLRLRVSDDNISYPISGPCSNLVYGQAEDYTLTFIANTQAPEADFSANDTIVTVTGSMQFNDLSIHAPLNWFWSFEGGTPSSSNLRNPVIRYDSLGVYRVSLRVTNTFGADSLIKNTYIHVVNAVNLCAGINSSTANNGKLYDSGGPSNDYNYSENCTLLLEPPCARSISLSFTQLNTEACCDRLRIYDGTTTSSPLILTASGSVIPPVATANSGKMLIVWSSDGSGNGAGYTADWTTDLGSPDPPLAAFNIQSTTPPFASPVQFTDQSLNTPMTWQWDFGDGASSVSQNPVHTYSNSGAYTVRLITSNCVTADTAFQQLNVQQSPGISIDPDSVYASGACRDTITIPLTIYNHGGGDLLYSVLGGDSSVSVQVLTMTYGVDFTTEFPNTINAISTYFSNYDLDSLDTTSPTVLQAALADKDVLLFPEQESGITTQYTGLANVVQDFANDGGTVIVCGSIYSGNQDIIYQLGLFHGNYVNYSYTGLASVLDTTDDIMDGIGINFNLENLSFMHNITDVDKVELASYNGSDLVTYRPFGKGKVIYIGFDFYEYNNEIQRIISNAVKYSKKEALPDWLSLDIASDTVQPADSSVINLRLTTNDLSGGYYNTYILIYSNDSLVPVDSIPVTLQVSFDACANFVHSTPSICSGLVSFYDSTLNTPISWNWDFGDGSYSQLKNPQHSYSAVGTYNVKLVSCNAGGCDSIEEQITINGVNGPLSPSCVPLTTAYCCGMGITNVQFNNLSNTSDDGTDGYQDYSCLYNTVVTSGLTYSLNVTTGTQYNENVRAWIDYNNNGVFEDSTERIMTSDNQRTSHIASVTIPNTAVTNVYVRMRIASDYWGALPISPCSSQQYGQTEDYAVFIEPNTFPPQANFNIQVINTCTGSVEFSDNSGNTPTSWLWDFGDSTSSTLQNPSHVYALPGTYSVRLLVVNPYGTDSVAKSTTVNVLNASMLISNNRYTGQAIQFTCSNGSATSYLWDFGDGYLSTLHNPVHVYDSIGIYLVSLHISNALCSLTLQDTLRIGTSDIGPMEELNSFELYPNPSSGEFNISYQLGSAKTVTIECFDLPGQVIRTIVQAELQGPGLHKYSFTPPSAGVYYIRFSENKESFIRKLIRIN